MMPDSPSLRPHLTGAGGNISPGVHVSYGSNGYTMSKLALGLWGCCVRVFRSFGVICSVILLWSCGAGGTIPGPGPTPTPPPAQSPIKHIVIIIQENRTVDNLFNGLPGADTVTHGLGHLGQTIQLHQVELENGSDPCHDHVCWLPTYDGGKLVLPTAPGLGVTRREPVTAAG